MDLNGSNILESILLEYSQNGTDDMDKIKEFIDELRSNCKKLDKIINWHL